MDVPEQPPNVDTNTDNEDNKDECRDLNKDKQRVGGFLYSFDSSDSDDDDMKDQFRRYHEQIDKYEGFRVDFVPSVFFWGAIRPVDMDDIDSRYTREARKCTDFAIKKHNEQNNTDLELVRIIRANYMNCAGANYYITFDAKDSSPEGKKTYQAEVYHGINEYYGKDGMRLKIFRPEESIN